MYVRMYIYKAILPRRLVPVCQRKPKNLRQHCHAIDTDCSMPRDQYAETEQWLSWW